MHISHKPKRRTVTIGDTNITCRRVKDAELLVGAVSEILAAKPVAKKPELVYVAPCDARQWRRITEPGFQLLSKSATEVKFNHGAFKGAVKVAYYDSDHSMAVYEGKRLIGDIEYRAPHRHPNSSWRAKPNLTAYFGGYASRPPFAAGQTSPGSGFIVTNFWPRRTHDDPLKEAVYRLCFAKMWLEIESK